MTPRRSLHDGHGEHEGLLGCAGKSLRRGYLDWLRGVGVLIMIASHVLDSWTREADRSDAAFAWARVIGGFGAPIFLLLAGVALALAWRSRVRRGATEAEAAAKAYRRGWQIVGLAFLFRLQAKVLSGGSWASMLKVDILNIMGLSMLGAAWLMRLRGRSRLAGLAVVVAALALLTPVVRTAPWLSQLPDWLEWYLRPAPGRTTFAIFPWSGFLVAGVGIGLWLDRARDAAAERRVNLALAAAGVAMAVAGYGASLLPPIYDGSRFWGSSPTFFFFRLGILTVAVSAAYGWRRLWPGPSPIETLGVASLFVYWIHVEMVYGMISLPLHDALTFPQALAGATLLGCFLFGLIAVKEIGQGLIDSVICRIRAAVRIPVRFSRASGLRSR